MNMKKIVLSFALLAAILCSGKTFTPVFAAPANATTAYELPAAQSYK